MRIVLCCVLLGLATLSLSACNTVEGMGKDMESAGRGLQNM